MAILTEAVVRAAAQRAAAQRMWKSANTILKEEAQSSAKQFDIFLSHARLDAEIVLGAFQLLQEAGRSVYVDWIVDPKLDRENVTAETAQVLRERMRQCGALFYLHSSNASKSRWMPWELGFFDGYNGNVAVFPVLKSSSEKFKGEEFLGIYPYVDLTEFTPPLRKAVYVHKDANTYKRFDEWRTSVDKLRPAA